MTIENKKEDFVSKGYLEKEKTIEDFLIEKRNDFAKIDRGFDESIERAKKQGQDISKEADDEYVRKKNDYISILKEYREKMIDDLDSGLSGEERKVAIEKILKETLVDEANALHEAKTESSLMDSGSNFKDKILRFSKERIDWYRGLGLKQKIAISAGLFGTAVAAGAVGGLLGTVLFGGALTGRGVQRVLAGSATGVALEGVLKKHQEKKTENELMKKFSEDLEGKLREADKDIDDQLFFLEGRKKSDRYKRYVISGTVGILVGSGAAFKAVTSINDFFGITTEKTSAFVDGVVEKAKSFFGSEALASVEALDISQGEISTVEDDVLDEVIPMKINRALFELTREPEFIRDGDGEIEGMEVSGNMIDFEPANYRNTEVIADNVHDYMEVKDDMTKLLYETQQNRSILDLMSEQGRVGSEEHEWLREKYNSSLSEADVKYGKFINERFYSDFPKEASIIKEPAVMVEDDIPQKPQEEIEEIGNQKDVSEEQFLKKEDPVLEAEADPEERNEDISSVEAKTGLGEVVETEKTDATNVEKDHLTGSYESLETISDLVDEVPYRLDSFVGEIEKGGTVWGTVGKLLEKNFGAGYETLPDMQKNRLINEIKDIIAEDPFKYGLKGNDIDLVHPGQKLDLSLIMNNEGTITKLESLGLVTDPDSDVIVDEVAEEEFIGNKTPDVLVMEEKELERPPVVGETIMSSFFSDDLSTEIPEKGSIWGGIEGLLEKNFNNDFEDLSETDKNKLIKLIEIEIEKNPVEYALEDVDNIHLVQPGQKLDISPILKNERIMRELDLLGLAFVPLGMKVLSKPKVTLSETLERSKAEDEQESTELDQDDKETSSVESVLYKYGIAKNDKNEEMVKSMIEVIKKSKMEENIEKVLMDVYFRNWNDKGSAVKTEDVFKSFFGDLYDDIKECFSVKREISREPDGKIVIFLEKPSLVGLGKWYIKFSPDGRLSVEGVRGGLGIKETSLSMDSLKEVRGFLDRYVKKFIKS